MSAIEIGAKQGNNFRLHGPVLFEQITREQYRKFGRMKAEQLYVSREKQNEFMRGWFAANQQFFHFLKDGPKHRVVKVTIELVCDDCGSEYDIEIQGNDLGLALSKEKYTPCPICEKNESR